MSFPAVSAWARPRSALTPRIAKIIDGVALFGLACHPQMRGTPKQRTTTGWLGRLSRFPTVGTPPVERRLDGVTRARRITPFAPKMSFALCPIPLQLPETLRTKTKQGNKISRTYHYKQPHSAPRPTWLSQFQTPQARFPACSSQLAHVMQSRRRLLERSAMPRLLCSPR